MLLISMNFSLESPSPLPPVKKQPCKENVRVTILRIASWISFYLSKLSDVKFSILYCASLVRISKENISCDHSCDFKE